MMAAEAAALEPPPQQFGPVRTSMLSGEDLTPYSPTAVTVIVPGVTSSSLPTGSIIAYPSKQHGYGTGVIVRPWSLLMYQFITVSMPVQQSEPKQKAATKSLLRLIHTKWYRIYYAAACQRPCAP